MYTMLASPRPLSPALEKRRGHAGLSLRGTTASSSPTPSAASTTTPWKGFLGKHLPHAVPPEQHHLPRRPPSVPRKQVQLLAAILRRLGQYLGNPHAVHTAEKSRQWPWSPTSKGLENLFLSLSLSLAHVSLEARPAKHESIFPLSSCFSRLFTVRSSWQADITSIVRPNFRAIVWIVHYTLVYVHICSCKIIRSWYPNLWSWRSCYALNWPLRSIVGEQFHNYVWN